MITIPIGSLIIGIALAVFSIYDLTKTKEKRKSGLWIISVGLLSFSAVGFYGEGSKSGTTKTMRQRLAETIISEVQLYGYEIVGKHIEKDALSDNKEGYLYFVDIRDWLVTKKILKKVKVTERFFNEYKLGDRITKFGKLNLSEKETSETTAPLINLKARK